MSCIAPVYFSKAIDSLLVRGTPVIGVLSPLTARGNVGYVGLDSFNVGRTATWSLDKICQQRGEIGILVGNTLYRNQHMNESGFRSYFREKRAGFTLLEPRARFEPADVAREMTGSCLPGTPRCAACSFRAEGSRGRRTSRWISTSIHPKICDPILTGARLYPLNLS